MKKSQVLTLVQVTLGLMLAGQAFAIRSENTLASLRQERGIASIVHVEGSLSCVMPAENNGKPCQLKLIENNTGKTFELIGSSGGAMRLLNDGHTNVAVDGSPAGGNVIDIKKVEKLL